MPDQDTKSPHGLTNEKKIWMAEKVIQMSICELVPYKQNNRVHTAKSIAKLKDSVEAFGFVVPILIDKSGVIIAGHGRYEAAKALGENAGAIIRH